jgi:hypothetical protein
MKQALLLLSTPVVSLPSGFGNSIVHCESFIINRNVSLAVSYLNMTGKRITGITTPSEEVYPGILKMNGLC